jgi:hypothetical protein
MSCSLLCKGISLQWPIISSSSCVETRCLPFYGGWATSKWLQVLSDIFEGICLFLYLLYRLISNLALIIGLLKLDHPKL